MVARKGLAQAECGQPANCGGCDQQSNLEVKSMKLQAREGMRAPCMVKATAGGAEHSPRDEGCTRKAMTKTTRPIPS